MRSRKKKIDFIQLDMTPLIDVVFQLLIFFLLASSFEMSTGIKVELPESKTSDSLQTQSDCIITLKKDDSLYINGVVTPLTNFKFELNKLKESKALSRVILQADRLVYYDRVVRVMDMIKELGITNVGLPTRFAEEEVPSF